MTALAPRDGAPIIGALMFFLASLLGLLTVCGSSWAVWKRAVDPRSASGESR